MVYTAFASAERAPDDEVRRQHELLSSLPYVREFIDAMPNLAVVLNGQRQIVLANGAFQEFLRNSDPDAAAGERRSAAFESLVATVLGRRTGEAMNCVHSSETEGGCGTTPFCRNCGAVNAIVNSQRWHALDVQECRLICGEKGANEMALDLRIWAHAIDVAGEPFTVFSMLDISDEKRRKALERIFFHDVMNTAGGVKGLADLMVRDRLPEAMFTEVMGMLSESADQLIDEIGAQRALIAAESGDLVVEPQEVQAREILDRVVHQFHAEGKRSGKTVRVPSDAAPFALVTDPVLLRRVLVNLVKNAIEALPSRGEVTLGARLDGDAVVFTVHNATVIPEDVQLQIFQRSFTTKGQGRGLGSYSIKLLTERYLRGRVWFISNAVDGTIFTVRLPRTYAPAPAEF